MLMVWLAWCPACVVPRCPVSPDPAPVRRTLGHGVRAPDPGRAGGVELGQEVVGGLVWDGGQLPPHLHRPRVSAGRGARPGGGGLAVQPRAGPALGLRIVSVTAARKWCPASRTLWVKQTRI